MVLVEIILATAFAGILSTALAAALLFTKWFKKASIALVAFAAGALMGAVFLNILPELIAEGVTSFGLILAGIAIFYILEQTLLWHHHKYGNHDTHPYVYLIIIGDAIHNFIDGAAIAASFLINVPLGIVTTLAVFFHEIPQEIGDFGVLTSSGLSNRKALIWNGMSAVIGLLGALVAWLLAGQIANISLPLLAFAAGNFIYIAGADLIPITHRAKFDLKALAETVSLLVGIGVIAAVSLLIG